MDANYIEPDESLFDDYIDEIHPVIEIFGIGISPSKVLYECDNIAYNVIFSDWESETYQEGHDCWECSVCGTRFNNLDDANECCLEEEEEDEEDIEN